MPLGIKLTTMNIAERTLSIKRKKIKMKFTDLPILVWIEIIGGMTDNEQYDLIVKMGYARAKILLWIIPGLRRNAAIEWEVMYYEFNQDSSMLKG